MFYVLLDKYAFSLAFVNLRFPAFFFFCHLGYFSFYFGDFFSCLSNLLMLKLIMVGCTPGPPPLDSLGSFIPLRGPSISRACFRSYSRLLSQSLDFSVWITNASQIILFKKWTLDLPLESCSSSRFCPWINEPYPQFINTKSGIYFQYFLLPYFTQLIKPQVLRMLHLKYY